MAKNRQRRLAQTSRRVPLRSDSSGSASDIVVKRGQIWWANLGGGAGVRPVLIITRDPQASYLKKVTVAPLTRTVRDFPSRFMTGPEDGMNAVGPVNFDCIQTIEAADLRRLQTTLSRPRMAQAEKALIWALGIGEASG